EGFVEWGVRDVIEWEGEENGGREWEEEGVEGNVEGVGEIVGEEGGMEELGEIMEGYGGTAEDGV
uniref:hypothetical protein n=1 Tax=Geobacillus sp. (strain Y412MC10) TaxID=481743 RepID=UPI001C92EA8D